MQLSDRPAPASARGVRYAGLWTAEISCLSPGFKARLIVGMHHGHGLLLGLPEMRPNTIPDWAWCHSADGVRSIRPSKSSRSEPGQS